MGTPAWAQTAVLVVWRPGGFLGFNAACRPVLPATSDEPDAADGAAPAPRTSARRAAMLTSR
eukprot:9204484-Alexandrium_andersonii.AAC.1